jgi:alpha,alpha-trehalase
VRIPVNGSKPGLTYYSMKNHLMRRPVFLLQLLLLISCAITARGQYIPDQQLAELFDAVQMQSVFEDSKTFPDCIPKQSPELIVAKYQSQKNSEDFDLK